MVEGEEKKAEETAQAPAPRIVRVLVEYNLDSGQMSFQTPRDAIVALGLLDLARRQIYKLEDANQAPKIERVPAGSVPGLKV